MNTESISVTCLVISALVSAIIPNFLLPVIAVSAIIALINLGLSIRNGARL